jgi:hypothetical protein
MLTMPPQPDPVRQLAHRKARLFAQSPKNAQEQVLIRPAAKIVMVALGHQRRHTILGA